MEVCSPPPTNINQGFAATDPLNSPLYEPRSLKLTVYQDPSCIWCYVGEREMQKAICSLKEMEEDVRIQLEFKPFIVDMSLPVDQPVDRREMYCSRYGSRRYALMQQFMVSRAAAAGIQCNISDKVRCPMLSQRLIMRAGQLGGGETQLKLIEEIGKRVFEQGEDVGCLGVLSESAAAVGMMCKEQAIAFLTSHRLEDEVQNALKIAREKGINGVPCAVINDKYAITGGQSSAVYLDVFTKVLRNVASAPGSTR